MYRETFILVAVLVLTRMGMSQNLVEPKSGLFGEATQLPIVSQSVIVKAGGADALFEVEQVFYNSGKSLSQAEYRLHLPEGASVTDFGFWDGGEYLGATLKER